MVREYSSEISSCAQIPMDRLLDEVYGLEIKLASMFVLLCKNMNSPSLKLTAFKQRGAPKEHCRKGD
jgi:hypothetical protein